MPNIKKHYILMLGIISLFLTILSEILIGTLELQYDDGGLGTILILGKAVYGFVFWIISEGLISIEKYIVIPFGDFVVYTIGMLIFFLLDLSLNKFRKNKK